MGNYQLNSDSSETTLLGIREPISKYGDKFVNMVFHIIRRHWASSQEYLINIWQFF